MIKSNIQLQGFLRETRQFNSRSNFANNGSRLCAVWEIEKQMLNYAEKFI